MILPTKTNVLLMTLKSILCSSLSSITLGNGMYSFNVITPRSTLTWSGSIYKVPSMDQIDLFENYSFSNSEQKISLETTKNVSMNIQ